jgi:hypothetical protein
MTIPPAAQIAQPLPPMERCYDCGDAIPEGQVYRREVEVSSSYSSGSIDLQGRDATRMSGSYGGSGSTYETVSLCPACIAQRVRDARERARKARLACGCAAAFFVACAAVVAGFWAFLFADHHQQQEAQEKAAVEAKPKREAAETEAKRKQDEAKAKAEAAEKERREAAEKERREAAERRRRALAELEEEAKRQKEAKKQEEKRRKEAEKQEEFAQARLKYARKLIADDQTEEARERLQKIIKELPDTKAATEARELLKQLDK